MYPYKLLCTLGACCQSTQLMSLIHPQFL